MNYLVDPVEVMLAGGCTCFTKVCPNECACLEDCAELVGCVLMPCPDYICVLA